MKIIKTMVIGIAFCLLNILQPISASELPYSNVKMIYSANTVLVGRIEYKGEVDAGNYRGIRSDQELATEIEFVVSENLGNSNYAAGDRLKVVIPARTLGNLDKHENGPFLGQSNDVLLGLDFAETDMDFNPISYKIKTQEYIVVDNNLDEIKAWLKTIIGADTPSLNKVMVQEWAEKGLDSETLADILNSNYEKSINPVVEERYHVGRAVGVDSVLADRLAANPSDSQLTVGAVEKFDHGSAREKVKKVEENIQHKVSQFDVPQRFERSSNTSNYMILGLIFIVLAILLISFVRVRF